MRSKYAAVTVLLALCALAGCEKAVTNPTPPQPPPSQILGYVSAPSVDATLSNVAGFIDKIQPGQGRMLNPALVNADLGTLLKTGPLNGVDWKQPAHLIWIDNGTQPPNLVFVFASVTAADFTKSADAKQEINFRVIDGHGFVGRNQDINLVAAWASKGLLATAAPAHPTVTVLAKHVMTLHGQEFETWLTLGPKSVPPEQRSMMEGFAAALRNVAYSSDSVQLSFDVTAQRAEMIFAIIAKPDTKLGQFFAAQSPSDYQLMSMLAGGRIMRMIGKFAWGPYQKDFADLIENIGPPWKASMGSMKHFKTGFEGGFAWDAHSGMRGIYKLDSASEAHAAKTAFLGGQKPGSSATYGTTTMTYTAIADFAVDNITFNRTQASMTVNGESLNLPMIGSGVTALGVIDNLLLFAGMERDLPALEKTLTAMVVQVRQPAAPDAATKQFIDDSRGHNESMAMSMDMQSITTLAISKVWDAAEGPTSATTPPLVVGFGFAKNRGAMRIQMAAESIAAMVQTIARMQAQMQQNVAP